MPRRSSASVIILSLFLSVFLFRFLQIADLIRFDNMDSVFRVGLIPWSDAANWVDGAADLLGGERIQGIASARPLYPAFLTLLLGVGGASYLIPVYLQIAVCAAVIAVGVGILASDGRTWPMALIMTAFWLVWRPDVNTLLITENLGMFVLIPAMAFLVRAFSGGGPRQAYVGFFLLGLSQAVRPWSLFILATVPLVIFFRPFENRHRWRRFGLAVVMTVAGFGCHYAATTVFNQPGTRYDNYLYTVYGQVLGGRGWTVVYEDPDIRKLLEASAPAQKVNALVLKKIRAQFSAHPGMMVRATAGAYWDYLRSMPEGFRRSRAPAAGFCIAAALLVAFLAWRHHPSWEPLVSLSWARRWILAVATAVMVMGFPWFWLAMAVVGLGRAVRHPTDRLHLMLLLFFAGIVMSIPLVGSDGGERVKLANDAWLYLCAAMGGAAVLRWIVPSLGRTWISVDTTASVTDLRPWQFTLALGLPVLVLIAAPLAIMTAASGPASAVREPAIEPEQLASRLGMDDVLLGPKALRLRWHQWPNQTFEAFDGRRACFPIRYFRRNALYLQADEGIVSPSLFLNGRHWPLTPQPFPRTVLVLENHYAMLPGKPPEAFGIPDGKRVWLIGTLKTIRRPFMHATGFVLLISHVADLDADGLLRVRAVSP